MNKRGVSQAKREFIGCVLAKAVAIGVIYRTGRDLFLNVEIMRFFADFSETLLAVGWCTEILRIVAIASVGNMSCFANDWRRCELILESVCAEQRNENCDAKNSFISLGRRFGLPPESP